MNMGKFVVPEKLKPGDKVAIVAPAGGSAWQFPDRYKQGLKRLREVFQLEPVEFPTVKMDRKYLAANPQARAEDVNRAFADPEIKAVIATIGGNDQIKILDYLDAKVIKTNPKIFLGLSDNTNLHLYLWRLGIVSYYGGNLMQQFAQNGKMDDYTVAYFKRALFTDEIGEIKPADGWNDVDFDFGDPTLLDKEKPMEVNPGWLWQNTDGREVQGRLWGGCFEIIDWQLLADKYLPTKEELSGSVLFMETSEELPTADTVYRMLSGLGIRGWLKDFSAILVGRPKMQFRGHLPPEGREKYAENQRQAILQATAENAPDLPVVLGLDFGHTDPQLLVPSGGIARIVGTAKKIFFSDK